MIRIPRRADRRWPKSPGTSHWVSAAEGVSIEVRLYDKLFLAEEPGKETGNFLDDLNPESLVVVEDAKAEPEVLKAKAGDYLQFIRKGYFCVDSKDSTPEKPIYNRTVTLRDTWARMKKKMGI